MSLGKGSEGDDAHTGPAPAVGRVLDASALKAYAHPLRVRMLRYLGDHEAATATELARFLGESTGQTSYHLRQLAKHGLVEDEPSRGTGRERWWKASSFTVDAATMREDPATEMAAKTLLSAMVQDRAESLHAWVTGTWPSQWAAVSRHDKRTLLLTHDELEAMNAAVEEVLDRYAELSRKRTSGATKAPAGADRVRAYFDAYPLLAASPGAGTAGPGAEPPATDDGA
ncbi:helix-turn-helix domain-containing protein [Georgenia sp. MJ206]|uniref:winged helix-turn-helix domain-containing protein n=1 Tax=Georgenia wangjunii TaxID=3117730 RepID=UPI002F26058B